MHVCRDCCKSFRNAGLLRRHRQTEEHKQIAKTMVKIGARQYPRKIYNTRNRKKMEKRANLFEAAAIANEFSVRKDQFPHSHSHLYLKTTELFNDMKKLLRKLFNIKPNDIVRPINIRQCIKYITKQDQHTLLINIPIKFTSTLYQHSYIEIKVTVQSIGETTSRHRWAPEIERCLRIMLSKR